MQQQNDSKILMILTVFIILMSITALFLIKNSPEASPNKILKCFDQKNNYVGDFEDYSYSSFPSTVQRRTYFVNNKSIDLNCYYEKYLLRDSNETT